MPAGVHQPAGHREDPAAQRRIGRPFQLGAGELTDGAAEVVRDGGQGEPGGAGHEVPGRQVRKPGALELGDGLLDNGVAAVVGLQLGERQGPIGDESRGSPRR